MTAIPPERMALTDADITRPGPLKDALDAIEIKGIGMPNGVVTASPGTYYTDTAGTNGAWRWLKKFGTGNTGWAVIVGDTGWRSIAYTGSSTFLGLQALRLRRVGTAVQVIMRVSSSGTGFVEPIYDVPPGFQFKVASPWGQEVTPWTRMGHRHEDMGTFYLDRVNAANRLCAYISVVRSGSGSLLWHTEDPWPTTLPGAPA